MTLLFRAVWRDDHPQLFAEAERTFGEWLARKQVEVAPPREGASRGTSPEGPVEVVTRRATVEGVRAARWELHEERGTGERWSTVLTALRSDDGEQHLWVDLGRVAEDLGRRPAVAAPALVRMLIERGHDARVDHVRLETHAHTMPPRPLAGLIRNPDRTLPIIVFSHDPGFEADMTIQRADRTQHRLMGAVQVVFLDPDQAAAFREAIGDGLAVWNGSARLYLPNRDAGGLRPERHRFILPARLGIDVSQPAAMFAGMLAGVITARRAPGSYEAVRRALREGEAASAAELLEVAEAEIAKLQKIREELRLRMAELEEDLFDVQADFEEATAEVAELRRRLAWSMVGEDSSAEEVTELERLAASPGSVQEAITWAQEHLTGIVVHPEAPQDIADLDAAVNAPSWAENTWRGLRALHLYALADHDGDFRSWCETSGHAWIWPATRKKLSMGESGSVKNRDRYKDQRVLPVDEDVDPSGRVHMWAHLKIAEGGGRLAPRVYFYDDTRGPTGKVHVGFIGPHHHMENTRTN